MMPALVACGTSAPAESALEGDSETTNSTNVQAEPSTPVSDAESSTPVDDTEADSSQADDTAQAEQTEGGSNMLVTYFSLAGEQYGVGVIEEGNTSIIARMIAEQTGADLFEIEAVTPYPTSHSELLDVSRQEMANQCDSEGTALNYEGVSEAISAVRCSAPLGADWKKHIDEDYQKRGGYKRK